MEKVVYKVGKFIDFAGYEREVVLCAVSQECDAKTDSNLTGYYEEVLTSIFIYGKVADSLPAPKVNPKDQLTKVLRLGIAIQSPQDSLIASNTELAKRIALGKAKKDRSCIGKLYSTKSGFINQKMVEALLEQELEYFKNAPHLYIKGYEKDKKLFNSSPSTYYSKFKIND